MKKTITVQLDDREVVVAKLPIGKYAELLRAVEVLPLQVSGLDKMTNDDVLAQLPKVISNSLPEFLKIISIATDLSEDEIAEMGLDEVVKLVMGVAEVNKFGEVFDTIKKGLTSQAVAKK